MSHPQQISQKQQMEKQVKKLTEQSEKHMFNWNALSKGNKYVNQEKKAKSPTDSPVQNAMTALRKNAHLEALPINPVERLAPINEEELRKKLVTIDTNEQNHQQVIAKKGKVLAKIDETLLSSMAKNQNSIGSTLDSQKTPKNKEKWNQQNLGAVGKLKPIFQKLPSIKYEQAQE